MELVDAPLDECLDDGGAPSFAALAGAGALGLGNEL